MKIFDLIKNANPLNEMTTLTGAFPDKSGIQNIMFLTKNGKYIGDMDTKQIYKTTFKLGKNNRYIYGIVNDNKITSVIVSYIIKKFKKKYHMIDTIYTLPEYRKKNDINRILFFMKSHDGLSFISGGSESPDTVSFIQNNFDKNYFYFKLLNYQTGEIIDYKGNEKFRNEDHKGHDWRIIIEGYKHAALKEKRWYNHSPEGPLLFYPQFFEDF